MSSPKAALHIQLALDRVECDSPRAPFSTPTSWCTRPGEDEELVQAVYDAMPGQPRQPLLPSLRRGWQTPDPEPSFRAARGGKDVGELGGYVVKRMNSTATTDDTTSGRGRSATSESLYTSESSINDSPHAGSPDWLRIRTPSPEMRESPACLPCAPWSRRPPPPPPPGVQPPMQLARPAEQEVALQESWPSHGSMGHPYTCQDACKYQKKARGCKDGADCLRCHLCTWQHCRPRPSRHPRQLKKETGVEMPAVADGSGTPWPWPSQGSIGHPHRCMEACKHMKKSFCWFGDTCRYCHICSNKAWRSVGTGQMTES